MKNLSRKTAVVGSGPVTYLLDTNILIGHHHVLWIPHRGTLAITDDVLLELEAFVGQRDDRKPLWEAAQKAISSGALNVLSYREQVFPAVTSIGKLSFSDAMQLSYLVHAKERGDNIVLVSNDRYMIEGARKSWNYRSIIG